MPRASFFFHTAHPLSLLYVRIHFPVQGDLRSETVRRMKLARAMRRAFDVTLFEAVVQRDGFTPQARPPALNRNARIRGLCACGESFDKSFRDVVQKGGGRCQRCTNVRKKQKVFDTNVERYGCAHPLQNAEVKQKVFDTNVERYGCANPFQNAEVKQKVADTNVERYGCANPFQNAEVKQKIADTNVERYGCAHPLQNAAIAELASKNAYKVKTYTFPCGDTRTVQGYEPFALDDLVRQGYRAEDVITARRDVPEVWWTAADGGRHRYFVDIFIPTERRMIEVKSSFTAVKEGVVEKARASRDAGFVFELWVYDPKGQRIPASL